MASGAPWVRHIESTIHHVGGLADDMAALTVYFQDIIRWNGEGNDEFVSAATTLSRRLNASTFLLQSCLEDLATMGNAMTPLLLSSPETAPSLIANLYSTFVRQVADYFKEVSDSFGAGGAALEESRAVFHRVRQRASSLSSAGTPVLRSLNGSATEVLRGDGRQAAEEPLIPAGETAVKPPSSVLHEDATATGVDREGIAGAADEPKAALRHLTSSVRSANEPSYLQVTSTVEESLGRLVMASRPNVFTPVALLQSEPPLVAYYIRLMRPGSLGHFVVANYIHASEEVQKHLLWEVLETDEVEVEPFVSTAGLVTVDDVQDLRALPSCAWRVGSTTTHTRSLHTAYTLVQSPPSLGPSVLVQDALVEAEGREEVLHIIQLVETDPSYAYVTAHRRPGGPSETVGRSLHGILDRTRNGYAESGFSEVPESEVVRAPARSSGRRASAPGGEGGRTFSSDLVPLEALATSGAGDGPALRLGRAAMEAVRGGMEALKMPLKAGKAAGATVWEATGVTEALRAGVETTFRRSFPPRREETIVDYGPAAWQSEEEVVAGQMFITSASICFLGAAGTARWATELDEIKDVQKVSAEKTSEEGIDITTHLQEHFVLVHVAHRDRIFHVLMDQWLRR